MTKTVMLQARNIKGVSNEEAIQRQILWIQNHQKRNEFLVELNKALDLEGFERDTKARSRKYSNTVVDYDREHRMTGWK